jgi:hypothetical protein
MDLEMGRVGRLGPTVLGPFWPISWPPLLVMLHESSRVFSHLHVVTLKDRIGDQRGWE